MMAPNCGCLQAAPVAQLPASFVTSSSPAPSSSPVPHVQSVWRATQRQTLRSAYFASGLRGLKLQTDELHVQRCQRKRGTIGKFVVNQSLTTPSAPPAAPPIKQETDIGVIEIADGIVSLRGRCRERPKYEIEYSMNHGSTENTYVIKGESSLVLIDVPDQTFSEAFTKVLADVIDLKRLKYLVLGHFSPKRLKSLTILVEALPDEALPLQVYCSNPAAQLLKKSFSEGLEATGISLNVVRAEDKLDLGEGRELQFFLTPTPRWPDGLCTYDPASQLLFSQKFFSAHKSEGSNYDAGGWDEYGEDWRFYYECMLAPTPQQAKAALDKLKVVAQFAKPIYKGKAGIELVKADMMYMLSAVMSALKIPNRKLPLPIMKAEDALVTSAICPLHGPIVRSSISELVREYGVWTTEKLKQSTDATVAVIYASAYGMTATLAQAISRGISKAGVGIEMLNVEIDSTDELIAVLQRCSGFIIGSPTLGGHLPTPVQNALGVILNDDNAKSKPCGVFGSFGWSGEAIDILETRLTNCGFELAFPSIRSKFQPTEATIQTCEESGTDLAQAVKKTLLKKRSQASPQFTVASKVEQAVGRVVGSLCVLSARSGDAESAMLASWVSQASFVPPGLTVAVAKDRAVEGLVLPGGRFVLNVLGLAKSGPVMKQLLKPFKPGEPRYEGLEITEASSGGFILKDAIAWMECTVQSRLETGDHWVLYALVDSGGLQDQEALTAVHYRKTGARY